MFFIFKLINRLYYGKNYPEYCLEISGAHSHDSRLIKFLCQASAGTRRVCIGCKQSTSAVKKYFAAKSSLF